MIIIFSIALLVSLYIVVYYRLLVRYYYQLETGRKEGAFVTLFSFPPYSALPEKGKVYAKRYWCAVTVMILCVLSLAMLSKISISTSTIVGN